MYRVRASSIVWIKTPPAYGCGKNRSGSDAFSRIFATAEITREYEAVAIGHMTAGGTVMNQSAATRPNVLTWRCIPWETGGHSLSHHGTLPCAHASALRLETGRTHQIRVHMAHITHRWWAIRFMVAVRVRQKVLRSVYLHAA